MFIDAVLFDLDGTLADTARDLFEAMNLTLAMHQHPTIANYDEFRKTIAYGTKTMLAHAFLTDPADPVIDALKIDFYNHYQRCLGQYTSLFEGMSAVLNYLDLQIIPWGIVTSKLTRFTLPLLEELQLAKRAKCVVTGDTLPYIKPRPEPLLYGCQLLDSNPERTLYVGDYSVDVEASKAAKMPNVIITNHYHHSDENPYDWHADYVVKDAVELLGVIRNRAVIA